MGSWGQPWGIPWGADSAVTLSAVTVETLQRLRATFSVAMDPDTLDALTDWVLTLLLATPGNLGSRPTVTKVEVQAGNTEVLLYLYPALTPGAPYKLQAPNAATVAPVPADPNVRAFIVQASLAPNEEAVEWPHGVLEGLTDVMGDQVQRMVAPWVTRLVTTFQPDDAAMLVESTFLLPADGGFNVWVDGHRFAISDVEGTRLILDTTVVQPQLAAAIIVGSTVALDVPTFPPLEETG